jgi:hypothetical protein
MVVLLVAGSVFAPLAATGAEEPDPRPTYASEMWGGLTPQGWGLTQFTITNPGPTITVTPGERVDLTLNSVDTIHQWFLDYNGDNITDPGEPLSAVFGPSPGGIVFTFNARLTPGAFWYSCNVHGWGTQRGRFIIAGNAPPTVTIAQPPGTPALTWSGGSTHTVQWSMMDPNDLVTQLTVWVNYSYNAGATRAPIAGPLLGAMSVPWTVPLIDATDVQVEVDVLDPAGAKASDAKALPNVDSTRPTVTGRLPAPGATDVPTGTTVEATFSEAMNQPTAEGALTLCRMPGCVPVPLTVLGWTGTTLRTQPSSALAGDTQYQATVSAAARDASDPGNGLLAASIWTFRTANTPPIASVGQPGAGSRWTGGSTHNVLWTATDGEDPSNALSVWINYSTTGAAPWTAIAGPVPGDTGSTPWTVPTADVATARINVTAADLGGLRTSALSTAFSIDSTPPTVSATNPTNGAPSVPVNANAVITFSEPMNAGVTGTAAVVGLRPVAGGAWVALTFTWDPSDTILTANPAADLATTTAYRLFVNGSAQDASDPGLGMGAAVTADFTTSATADATPPQIADVAATPPAQVAGGTVEISANVTDDVAVGTVAVNVTRPDASTTNLTMALGTGDRFAVSQAWTQDGTHAFVIWALDMSGNGASASGTFTIAAVDDTPPTIAHTPPAGPHRVGDRTRIEATVTDDVGVVEVRIDVVDANAVRTNTTMISAGGGLYYVLLPSTIAPGTVRYHFTAVDAVGNVAVSTEYELTVEATVAPADYTLLVVAGVLIAVALAALALLLLLRRRKKGGTSEGPGENGAA